MIYRTIQEAHAEPGSWASWKTKVIRRHIVGGRTFYSTHMFDTVRDRCKKCRKAANQVSGSDGGRRRLACTGRTCDRCGNPFAAFTRQGRLGDRLSPNNPNAVNQGWWTEGGRLH